MKKWWYREEFVGDTLVCVTSYGCYEEEDIIRMYKRNPGMYDQQDWTIKMFDTEEKYLRSLINRVSSTGCGYCYTNYNKTNLKAHNLSNKLGSRMTHLPNPVVKDGKCVCPICGEELYMSQWVILTNPPFYTYYCDNCTYRKEITEKIEEAKIDNE